MLVQPIPAGLRAAFVLFFSFPQHTGCVTKSGMLLLHAFGSANGWAVLCAESSSTYTFYSSSKVILECISNCISLPSLFFMAVSLAVISSRLRNAWLGFSKTLELFPCAIPTFFAFLYPQAAI